MESPDTPDIIDLADYAERGIEVPHGRHYRVRIDGDVYEVPSERLPERALLELTGKRDCAYELVEQFHDRENFVVEAGSEVDLTIPGLKGFITAHRAVVTIWIDNKDHSVERGSYSVAQILGLAGVAPDAYDLLEEKGGAVQPVSDKATIVIHGCEIFFSQVKSGSSS
jgi:hypothetical protein